MTTQPNSVEDESGLLAVSEARLVELVVEALVLPVASTPTSRAALCLSWGAVHDFCLDQASANVREAS